MKIMKPVRDLPLRRQHVVEPFFNALLWALHRRKPKMIDLPPPPTNQDADDLRAMHEGTINLGGGNYWPEAQLAEDGVNEAQIHYLRSLLPTWVRGQVLEAWGVYYHYDAGDDQPLDPTILARFKELGADSPNP